MAEQKEERKGGAAPARGGAALPILPAVLKPAAAGGGFKALLAGKAGLAALSGLLGLATVGGYQALTGP